jgi:hypothetical protein
MYEVVFLPGTRVCLTAYALENRTEDMQRRQGLVIGEAGDYARVMWDGKKEAWSERKENLESC